MSGMWLALSPFIFGHDAREVILWVNDFAAASAIAIFALLSYWPPARYAHLLTVAVALWLLGFGRFGSPAPIPPALQNEIAVGLLLLMFAIVPNYASMPPQPWRGQSRLEG